MDKNGNLAQSSGRLDQGLERLLTRSSAPKRSEDALAIDPFAMTRSTSMESGAMKTRIADPYRALVTDARHAGFVCVSDGVAQVQTSDDTFDRSLSRDLHGGFDIISTQMGKLASTMSQVSSVRGDASKEAQLAARAEALKQTIASFRDQFGDTTHRAGLRRYGAEVHLKLIDKINKPRVPL